ncbi:MAG: cyclase family protein [Chloroflexi bacterium]|nr:cyclase family protein [Chloroflexota bacterium]
MKSRRIPTQQEVNQMLKKGSNWGRWGKDDQKGALNLITPQKRIEAAKLVKSGRLVSLSRDFPTKPRPGNHYPADHWMRKSSLPGRFGSAVDYIGIFYHGGGATHIDALCHVWDNGVMWNGRDPNKEITYNGATWGSIEAWADGIATRGVLLDIPKLRGTFVEIGEPVHGWDLEAAVKAQGVKITPGDALVIHCGREAWQRAHAETPWGCHELQGQQPGLHASCLEFIRECDASMLVWDMIDARPSGYDLLIPVHGVLFSYGMALVDNALLEPLAQACAEEKRYDFMLAMSPLKVVGATGSPINPMAIF